ncbi:hypothetical protein SPRG_07926 [Saprolegnia parasitica CBS 223.65]|uniref:Uncharacterized protein n=1 Tax=Saprolegnia parasitica (strain CBS 223.65) TaxID=695850 RepID=A0A067C6W5_SAPPC|nr:hypothetical protein SPRG_07926 [Saprolegnia parasitica CBS 223.65]KDO26524.1 hypothetical protein SPRG_07926 [Saprolegnia parasitica CBS 223.65]|eukprot:XP_012202667.1 hypothetical protein SPRG_07926 [Saprolegnia parasitica CBS 223.65]
MGLLGLILCGLAIASAVDSNETTVTEGGRIKVVNHLPAVCPMNAATWLSPTAAAILPKARAWAVWRLNAT